MRPRCLLRPLCLGLLLILLLSRLPESPCFLQEYEDCRDPNLLRCGGEAFDVSYPFLAADRHEYCGFGEHYKLSCRDGVIPVVEIGGRSYRVKRIDYVADLAASQNRICPLVLVPYETGYVPLKRSLFEYSDDLFLNLYGNCTPVSHTISYLYEVPYLAFRDLRSYAMRPGEVPTDPLVNNIMGSCDSTAVVPLGGTAARSLNLSDTGSLRKAVEEGFNLTWTPGYNSRGCISSGGVCGHYSSNETDTCFCSDNASAGSCPPSPAKAVAPAHATAACTGGRSPPHGAPAPPAPSEPSKAPTSPLFPPHNPNEAPLLEGGPGTSIVLDTR